MDRAVAITLLPEAYAEAIRLHEAGLDDLIPDRLEIPPESVDPLLRLAEAKLARLLRSKAESTTSRESFSPAAVGPCRSSRLEGPRGSRSPVGWPARRG